MALKTIAARTAKRAAFLLSHAGTTLHLASLGMRVREARFTYVGDQDDIFIVSYPKSGTTWMQMILYQLTTNGSMNIPHIDVVVPHFEETLVLQNKRVSDLPPPRIVKTHLPYHAVPKGPGRYIYVMRDGRDVAVSYFHQLLFHRLRPVSNNFNEFFKHFLRGDIPYGSWFDHLNAWLKNGKKLRVHFVTYEELTNDLEGTIRGIAAFCDLNIDESELPRILHNCSFAFMQQHEKQFSLSNRPRAPAALPVMMRTGKAGSWRDYLDDEM